MGYTYRKYPPEFLTSIKGKPVRLYMVWYDMIKRCAPESRDARWYFERGISVCEEWKYWPTFATWARSHGYADSLELDRIEGNKGYGPTNCRFVTEKEQVENRDQDQFIKSCVRAQRAIHAKKFVCQKTGEAFMNAGEAAEKLGLKTANVSAVLRGRQRHTQGFRFSYI
jgi:hypothetical protein